MPARMPPKLRDDGAPLDGAPAAHEEERTPFTMDPGASCFGAFVDVSVGTVQTADACTVSPPG